jgi:hypothetical protein
LVSGGVRSLVISTSKGFRDAARAFSRGLSHDDMALRD